ncbi:MAG: alpha-amylase family glycosyl hydrolase [Treponema sp.]|nr:alpha-amylase family glycosyl hydrolase [Treponema sp.]
MIKKFFSALFVFLLVFVSCPTEDNGFSESGFISQEDLNVKGLYGNYYEIFVGSFYDSDNDGIGDFKGIIQKLDYLNDGNPDSATSLNIDGIWLMPIGPSGTYHKYDCDNYKAIDPSYGTMKDFENFIKECNERGVRVIVDLVVNHTSINHPWFLAAKNGNSKYMNYYVLYDEKAHSRTYRLGQTGKYYEAVFWDAMPDLNYDNPELKKEFESIIDFWLEKGVSGFRLDAVKHIYESDPLTTDIREKNIEWLDWFTSYARSKKSNVYVIGEVWGDNDTIIDYYRGNPSSLFSFPSQNQIPLVFRDAPAHEFAEFVVNWNAAIKTNYSEGIDGVCIGSHDVERYPDMVGRDPRKIKLSMSILQFMPGNPFHYYGEELGMTAKKGKDENLRGPMIWSRSNSVGETYGPEGNDEPYWKESSVEEQLADPDSILRFYIDTYKLKNRYPQVHWGTPSLITTTEPEAISAYKLAVRAGETELAVVHNVSESEKTVTIPGAESIGGSLNAAGNSAKPELSGSILTIPAYTTAIIEL